MRASRTIKGLLASIVLGALACVAVPAAGALTISGCTVVPNPTPQNHTNCAGMDLAHARFENLNLAYADFHDAGLEYSSFLASDLHGANFDGSDQFRGNLGRTNLVGASLRRTGLGENTLAWSDASGAHFNDASPWGANLVATTFTNADLSGADLNNALVSNGGPDGITSFAGAILAGSDFSETDLQFPEGPFMPASVVVGAPDSSGVDVTWPAPLSLAGATAGPCSPPSGSHFPIGVTTVTCRVDDDHGTFGFARFTVDVQIAAPSVVTQPSPVTVPAGTTATFSAAASGLPQPDVKWESSRDGGASFTAIPGATSPTYSFVAQVFDDGALFRAVFSNPYGTVSTDSARLTVTPVTPVVVAGVGTATEPDGGTTTLVSVPVKLSVASKDPVSVQWQTLDAGAPRNDGFATTPDDFTMAGGTVTFAPGETQASVAISIVGDQVHEPKELIVVAFHDPTNATIGGFWGLGFGTIVDNDPVPTIVPGVGNSIEGDQGTTALAIPVTLSNPSAWPVTVHWQTLDAGAPRNDGFATTPEDFTMASGTVTFAPGETQASIAVPIVGDQVQEPNELIVVAFTAPQQATLGGVWGLGFGVITNDD